MEQLEPNEHAGNRICRRESSYSDDHNIQLTNDEAADCKRAAVHMGYYDDQYLDAFFHQKVDKKEPEINRGYWARIRAVRILVDKFLKVKHRHRPGGGVRVGPLRLIRGEGAVRLKNDNIARQRRGDITS